MNKKETKVMYKIVMHRKYKGIEVDNEIIEGVNEYISTLDS